MNLAKLGLTALNTAQARLTTTSHNINNYDTAGYTRQETLISTAGASSSGTGFFGRGVAVETVRRAYSSFLNSQLVNNESKGALLAAYGGQISQINNVLADRTVGIGPSIQSFFDGVNAVASNPADPASRQELLGRTQTVVTQFNELGHFLDQQRGEINSQIDNSVTSINAHLSRISQLNQQIVQAKGVNPNHEPNDLLDQRDYEISQLNQIVNVNVVEQDNQVSISVGNGQQLLTQNKIYPLTTGPSAENPKNTVVYATIPVGKQGEVVKVELDETKITGGSLGGLLKYRRETLEVEQREVGQLATAFALSMNEANAKGLDLKGEPGKAFFNVPAPIATANSENVGNVKLTASFQSDAAGKIQASDYAIYFDGNNYTVTRESDNHIIHTGATLDGVAVDGMQLKMEGGVPSAGDRWALSAVAHSPVQISVAMTNADQIAAADAEGGVANGNNALDMAKLQSNKVLGGTKTFNESFSQIVNRVGVQAQQNEFMIASQNALTKQSYSSQQALSGVNLNEEYIKLEAAQEMFLAASRIIEVSSVLMDTILSLK